MKHIKLYENFITEEKNDLTQVYKALKFPAGSRLSNDSISWDKKGGHAGDKAVYRVMKNAEELGWKREFKQSTHPAYDIVSNNNVLFDPEGKYKLEGYQKYGQTASDNWYSLKLTKIPEKKDDLSTPKQSNEIRSIIKSGYEEYGNEIRNPEILANLFKGSSYDPTKIEIDGWSSNSFNRQHKSATVKYDGQYIMSLDAVSSNPRGRM